MNLDNIRMTLIRQGKSDCVSVIALIQKTAKQNNLTISNAITKLQQQFKFNTPRQKSVLKLCRSIYPKTESHVFLKSIQHGNEIEINNKQIETVIVQEDNINKKSQNNNHQSSLNILMKKQKQFKKQRKNSK